MTSWVSTIDLNGLGRPLLIICSSNANSRHDKIFNFGKIFKAKLSFLAECIIFLVILYFDPYLHYVAELIFRFADSDFDTLHWYETHYIKLLALWTDQEKKNLAGTCFFEGKRFRLIFVLFARIEQIITQYFKRKSRHYFYLVSRSPYMSCAVLYHARSRRLGRALICRRLQ